MNAIAQPDIAPNRGPAGPLPVNSALGKRRTMKSMKLFSLLVIGLFLSAWVQAAEVDTAKNYEGHSIIGTWSFDMNGCMETYEFLTDGTRNSTSAEEVIQATYTISAKPLDSGFYKLNDKVIKHNGKRNCPGSTKDRSGEVWDLYVRFNAKMDQIVFCLDESLNRCFGPFRKKQLSSNVVAADRNQANNVTSSAKKATGATNLNLVKIFHQTVTFRLPKEWGTPPKGNRNQKGGHFMLEHIPDKQDWGDWQDLFSIQGLSDLITRQGIPIEKIIKVEEQTAKGTRAYYKELYRGDINGYQGAIILRTANSNTAKILSRPYTKGEVVLTLYLAGENDLYIATRSWKADISPMDNRLPISGAEIDIWVDLFRQVKLTPAKM